MFLNNLFVLLLLLLHFFSFFPPTFCCLSYVCPVVRNLFATVCYFFSLIPRVQNLLVPASSSSTLLHRSAADGGTSMYGDDLLRSTPAAAPEGRRWRRGEERAEALSAARDRTTVPSPKRPQQSQQHFSNPKYNDLLARLDRTRERNTRRRGNESVVVASDPITFHRVGESKLDAADFSIDDDDDCSADDTADEGYTSHRPLHRQPSPPPPRRLASSLRQRASSPPPPTLPSGRGTANSHVAMQAAYSRWGVPGSAREPSAEAEETAGAVLPGASPQPCLPPATPAAACAPPAMLSKERRSPSPAPATADAAAAAGSTPQTVV
eukprot:Rhum_TRINITY_DN14300_c0_g1::Rhum_TRINITY_DN14300_c0_g1_i1::g.79614::m.79614